MTSQVTWLRQREGTGPTPAVCPVTMRNWSVLSPTGAGESSCVCPSLQLEQDFLAYPIGSHQPAAAAEESVKVGGVCGRSLWNASIS